MFSVQKAFNQRPTNKIILTSKVFLFLQTFVGQNTANSFTHLPSRCLLMTSRPFGEGLSGFVITLHKLCYMKACQSQSQFVFVSIRIKRTKFGLNIFIQNGFEINYKRPHVGVARSGIRIPRVQISRNKIKSN